MLLCIDKINDESTLPMELPESEVTDESPIVLPPTSASTSLDIEIIPEKPNHPVMSQFPMADF